MIIRGKVTEEKLQIIYKTIQEILPANQYQHCYNTIEEIKKDKRYIEVSERSEK